MARGRLISKSLGSSRKFHALLSRGGKLGEFCQILYPLLVANTDDFGRMPGDAFTVKNVVLPSSPRPERDFDAALDVMHSVGIIVRYVVDGEQYVQIVDFDAHQPNLHKRVSSRFPEIPENPGDSGISRRFQPNPEENLTQNPEENPEPRREPRTAPRPSREADVLFEEFWVAYPKKKAKDAARKAWDKRRPDRALLDAMLRALAVQCRSHDWQKQHGQFVPYPATWLNDARWTDVVTVELDARPTAHADYDAWPSECARLHGGTCAHYQAHQLRLAKEAAA